MHKKLKIGFSFNFANGGPSNFLKNLRKTLMQNKICKTSYFINPFTDCNIYSNKVRNPWNKPYVYRVDGVGYDTSRSNEHLTGVNDLIVDGINESIGIVYQTHHSKKMVDSFLDIKPNKSTIIINGTNLEKFCPNGDDFRVALNISENALVFISSAKWRPQKRLEDIVEVFKIFKKTHIGETHLIIIGVEKEIDYSNNIIYLPIVENEDMPKYLRSADIYLFFSWLDACPNSVLEAIACNIPVICTNQGGTKEILNATNGGIIVNADEEYNYKATNLQKPPKPDYEKVLDAITLMVKDLDTFKNQIETTKIDINYVANAYYNFLTSCYE